MSEPVSTVAGSSVADESFGAVSWSWDIATGAVTWAAGMETLFGLQPGAFDGTFDAYLALVHEDDRAYFQAVIARTLDGGDEYVTLHRIVWLDGSVHWIDAHGRLSRDAEGRPLVLSGVVWTPAARKLREARLTHLHRVEAVASAVRKELLRVQTDVEAFEHACRIVVEHGHFRFAWIGCITGEKRYVPLARAGLDDGYIDAITGTIDVTAPGPIGRTVQNGGVALVNDIATDEVFAAWRDAALRRGYRACGTFPLRRGGEVVAVLGIYAAEANRFDADQIELLRGLVDDIGFKLDTLEADARRNELQQQLILSDRLASLGRLAASVAHEINNPLAYLSLSLERIAGASAAPSPTVLETIAAAAADARDGAERVRAITRSLASLSRDDKGAVHAVDIHRVLDGAVRISENNVRHRGRIVKEYGAGRSVRGNELRFAQVFVNLLVNASDALREETPGENTIVVRTFDQDDRVIVEVRDNGIGIPPEIRERIFDPFFTTKPVGAGTGLGLSISHGILSTYGGEISVELGAGSETVFRVSMVADAALMTVSPRAPAVQEKGPRIRLLIIDDEERVANGLAGVLAHHDVTVATSAAEALSLCVNRFFDCILCDLIMPGVTGMDLYEDLRRDGRGLEHRMLFMTGGAFTARAREFVAQLGAEVLEKPFGGSRAEGAITKLLEDVAAASGQRRAL